MDEGEPCVDVNLILQLYHDWTSITEVRVIYSVTYALIFLIGVIGNGLLISSIVLRKRYTVANAFLINLAISDLLLCITAVPVTPALAFMKRWLFGLLLCKIVPSCQAISVLISAWSLCYIAMDRFRSIVTPLKEPWNLNNMKVFISVLWVGAIIASSPLYFMQGLKTLTMENITLCGEFCGEFNWPQDDSSKVIYGTALLMLQFFIPTVIMSYCYFKILQKVRSDWMVDDGSMLTNTQQSQTANRKKRVMYVLMAMVLVFMLSWLPLSALNIVKDLGLQFLNHQMYFLMLFVHAIAMSSVIWNPVLYFWMSKRHRRALKEDMTWLTNARRHTSVGVLSRFAPSPSVSVVYRRNVDKRYLNNFRRGTLADPTCMLREQTAHLHSKCFLLVPLMPFCQDIHNPTPNLAIQRDNRSHHSPTPRSNGSRNTTLTRVF